MRKVSSFKFQKMVLYMNEVKQVVKARNNVFDMKGKLVPFLIS